VRTRNLLTCLALCLGLAAACASTPPRHLPPVTEEPTDIVRPGKFVWIDLVTQDVPAAKSFYGDLFGWTFREGDRYTEILHAGRAIAGIVPADDAEQGSEWVGNLSVRDVDAAARFVVENGGLVERGPVDAPERGRLALVSDQEGALLLLVRSASGDPPDQDPAIGNWLWRELWTHDVAAAIAFYSALADYDNEEVELAGLPYHVLRDEVRPRAGVVEAPPEVNPLWLPYVRVDDTRRVSDAAAALGARVVMQHEQSAILVDPTGAPFAIQVWDGRRRSRDEGASR
jgi:predicted enzyme related to lactoylglutathione lyase